MSYKGSEVYDQEAFFQHYTARRERQESPNERIESPVFKELLGDVTGQAILDLGCGHGSFGNELLQQGCQSYHGVDGSKNMVNAANVNLEGTNSTIYHSSLESWDFPEESYDTVISRLVFHYIDDVQSIFNHVHATLKDEGRFVFSVQHPVLTSSIESAARSPKKSNWIVDEYFETGKRVEPWIEEEVVKYHRTVENYFRLLKKAGFSIEDIRECAPQREQFDSEEEYKRRKRIPLFLVFSCRK